MIYLLHSEQQCLKKANSPHKGCRSFSIKGSASFIYLSEKNKEDAFIWAGQILTIPDVSTTGTLLTKTVLVSRGRIGFTSKRIIHIYIYTHILLLFPHIPS